MARPRISVGAGRKLIREVLNMGPGYGYTQAALLENLNELASPKKADWSEVREWFEWNHARDFVRTEWNEDLDEKMHFITEEGIAKEAVR